MNPYELNPEDHPADEVACAFQTAFAHDEPSVELLRRLQVKANEAYRRPSFRWTPRLRSVVALAGTLAVAGAVVLMTLTPSKAAAKSFALVQQAVDQVRSFQLLIHTKDEGKDTTFSIAAIDGRFAMRTSKGPVMKLDGKTMEIYSPQDNSVTSFKFAGMPGAETMMDQIQSGIAKGMKEIDIKKMMADYREKYGDHNISVSPVTKLDGRDVYTVRLQSPNEPERVAITADALTDLPVHVVADKRDDNGVWGNEATIDLKFDGAVDENLLNVEFPANARRVEMNLNELMKGFPPNVKVPNP
jgi:hypothetical protein